MHLTGFTRTRKPGAFLSLALFCGSVIPAEAKEPIQIRCAQGRGLSIEIGGDRAIASFEGRKLTLPRRPAPLGMYFRSDKGALVIDDNFVAFVPKGDPNWRDCGITPPSREITPP